MYRLIPTAALAALTTLGFITPREGAKKPNVVSIKASEYSFSAPSSIPAGVTTIRLTSSGKELHHVQLVRLLDGKSMSDFMTAMKTPGPPPAWAKLVGGPNAPAPGGAVSEATLTLVAGNYVLLCMIPSPSDGTPHLMKGMVQPLTVTAAAGPSAAEPRADVTMRLNDYGFITPRTMTRGKHTFRVINDAAQPHEVIMAALAPGKTAQDMAKWIEDGQKGAPPGMPAGGTTGMEKGASNVITANMKKGEYALLCFMPDAKDGKPHVAHGMVSQITVK